MINNLSMGAARQNLWSTSLNLWAREGSSKEEGSRSTNWCFIYWARECQMRLRLWLLRPWSPTIFVQWSTNIYKWYWSIPKYRYGEWTSQQLRIALIFWKWAKGMAVTYIDQDSAVDQWMFLHHPSSLCWLTCSPWTGVNHHSPWSIICHLHISTPCLWIISHHSDQCWA